MRYIFCKFGYIFINSCSFVFYWNCKGYESFNILSYTSNLFFEFFCLLFSDNIIIKIGSILKTCRNFFWCIIFWIIFPMCSTSILPSITRVIFNFTTFIYISHIYFQDFLGKYNRLLHFHVIAAALLLIASFFLLKINYLYCVLS